MLRRHYGDRLRAWVSLARQNADANHITNARFICGDASLEIPRLLSKGERFDAIILDPPRKGCDDVCIQTMLEIAPKRIVYVSCNPATQARDLQLLDVKYKVTAVQPVDMFPHTHHVENVVALKRR